MLSLITFDTYVGDQLRLRMQPPQTPQWGTPSVPLLSAFQTLNSGSARCFLLWYVVARTSERAS
jgi:formate-dependent nitrite reductase membrane component NrfD